MSFVWKFLGMVLLDDLKRSTERSRSKRTQKGNSFSSSYKICKRKHYWAV